MLLQTCFDFYSENPDIRNKIGIEIVPWLWNSIETIWNLALDYGDYCSNYFSTEPCNVKRTKIFAKEGLNFYKNALLT